MWLRYQCRFYSSTTSRMAFDRFGSKNDKPPLVIGHGLFGSRRNWRSVAKLLQQRLGSEVYTVDFRNHGESPHCDDHSFSAMADDLLAFLSDLRRNDDIKSFNLLGHSMGGMAMSHFALNSIGADELIHKLIIEDIAPNRAIPNTAILGYLHAMKSVDLNKSRREIDDALKPGVPDASILNFLMMNLIQSDEDAEGAPRYRWQMNLETIERSLKHDFQFQPAGRCEKPTLFLAGGNSDYVRSEDHQPLKELFPNSSVETIPNAGHWIHVEQPKHFLDVVVGFLSS